MRRPLPSGRVAIFVATSAAPRATTSAAMWPASEISASEPLTMPDHELDDEERGDQPEGDREAPPVPAAGVAVTVSCAHHAPRRQPADAGRPMIGREVHPRLDLRGGGGTGLA